MGFALVATPTPIVSVSGGTIVYYMIQDCKVNNTGMGTLEADNAGSKFRYMIDRLMNNKEMLVMMIAFAVVIVIVYCIRRLSLDPAWTIALVVGSVAGVVFLLLVGRTSVLGVSFLWLVFGLFFYVVVYQLFLFFVFIWFYF